MTAVKTIRVESVPRVSDQPDAMRDLRRGLAEAMGSASSPAFDDAYDAAEASGQEEPAVVKPWDRLINEVADEVAEQVAPLLDGALARRLPWEWPERS